MNLKFIDRLTDSGFTQEQATLLMDIFNKDQDNLLDWYRNYPFATRGCIAGFEARIDETIKGLKLYTISMKIIDYTCMILGSVAAIKIVHTLGWL